MTATLALPRQQHSDWLSRLRSIVVLRTGQRVVHVPGIGVSTSRRAVNAGGNGLLDGLIAYWPGNEASGNLQDAHTNALHLTDTNTVTSAAGKVYSTARQYTAANEEYHAKTNLTQLECSNSFSLAGWMVMDSFSVVGRTLVQSTYDTGGWNYWLRAIGNPAPLWFGAGSQTSEVGVAWGSNITLSAWTCFVVTWNVTTKVVTLSVNGGTPVSTSALSGTLRTKTTNSFFLVGYSPGRPFDGRFGPVASWQRVFGAEEIAAWYNAGNGLAFTELT